MEKTAQCACKNVTVIVSGDPQLCFACHCDYCQRATGSIGTFGAVFLEKDIAVERKMIPQFIGHVFGSIDVPAIEVQIAIDTLNKLLGAVNALLR